MINNLNAIASIDRVVLSEERLKILSCTIKRLKYSDYKPVAKRLGISAVTCKRQADKAISQINRAQKNCARIVPRHTRRRFI